MPDFHYQDGELHCEAVPLRTIAEKVGTPCYVYSHATVLRQFRAFDSAFNEIPHLVAYAIKANSTLALLRLLAREGVAPPLAALESAWRARVAGVLGEATLEQPASTPYRWHGRRGVHSEHLGHLLAEMQYLQRTYPGAQW